MRHPLALVIRRKRPATVRPFLPAKPKPAQIFQHRHYEFGFATLGVEVFVAQDQHPVLRLRTLLRHPESPRVAEVKIARR
jgi:hypothetical protein